MDIKGVWLTKEEVESQVKEHFFNQGYSELLGSILKTDPDYCLRGYVHDPKTNLYAWYPDWGER